MEAFYRIKVNLGEISFELESHDKEWLMEKEKYYLGELFSNPEIIAKLKKRTDSPKSLPSTEIAHSQATINEFYRKFISAKNLPRNIIALMLLYYLEKIRNQESISTNDIKSAFKEISYPKYDKINFTDTLNQLKGKGFLNKVNKGWKLTITGLDYVLNQIASE
jgi:hypothetical protein